MNIPFLNRTKEIDRLKEIYGETKEKNHVVLVSGPRGIGKSELTNKFIDNYVNAEDIRIKLAINQKNKDYDEGYYIQQLGSLFNDLSEKNEGIESIEKFILGINSVILKERLFISVKNDFKKIIPGGETINEVFKKIFKSENYKSDYFLKSKDNEITMLIYDYIKKQLIGRRLTIKIENFQSIDDLSLELIIQLLSNSSESLTLIEYTENEPNGMNLEKIIAKISSVPQTFEILSVEPMDLEEFRDFFRQYPELTFRLIKESYIYKEGNLRPLVDYFIKLKHDPEFKLGSSNKWLDKDFTQYHIENLRKSNMFLLILIYAHNSETDITHFSFIPEFYDFSGFLIDPETSLNELVRLDLVVKDRETVRVAHDHISTAIKQSSKTQHHILLSYKFWLFVYEEQLLNDPFISKSERLYKILYFTSILGDQFKTISYLGEISREAVRSSAPKKLISYVEHVKLNIIKDNFIEDELLRDIDFWLIELYHKLNMSQNAYSILKELRFNSRRKFVLKGILMEQTGRQHDAIEMVNQILENTDEESNYTLALKLIRLVCLFDIGLFDQCRDEFESIYMSAVYSDLFEYGFLLRNAELVYNFKEAIPFYVQSIEHFKRYDADRQAAFSRIGLAVHLGLTGELIKAECELKVAEKELENSVSERHTILNNLAVIAIYKGDIGPETQQLLRQALVSAESDFNKVAINSNYLALMDWNENESEAEEAIQNILTILKKPSFASLEIIRYAYFNIMKYYEGRSMLHERNRYHEKILSINLEVTPIWKYWLNGHPIPEEDEEYFTASIDRAVSYLTHWNMDYDSNLMHY